MAYRLRCDETIADGVRRIAREQLDDALALLDAPGEHDTRAAVHEVRKACKKVRGLVRLVRPAMGEDYRAANVACRDAARKLSSIRDAHALLATFDDVVAAHVGELDDGVEPSDGGGRGDGARRGDGAGGDGGVAAVRSELARRARAASQAVAADDEHIARARELLIEARHGIDGWSLPEDFDAVAAGAAKTYRRGRKRLADSLDDPTDRNLHQWRKRAKYTWYHVRLLRDAAPSVLRPLANRFHDLSDALGDDHDLGVLAGHLGQAPDDFGGDAAVQTALGLIAAGRSDLQERAWRLGARLYTEPPKAFAARLAGYWAAWHRHGDELDAGEITDLSPPSDGLDDMTTRELYRRARDRQITGRSSMDRATMIAAIRAAAVRAAGGSTAQRA